MSNRSLFDEVFDIQGAVNQKIGRLRRDVRSASECFTWAEKAPPRAIPTPEQALKELHKAKHLLENVISLAREHGFSIPPEKEAADPTS